MNSCIYIYTEDLLGLTVATIIAEDLDFQIAHSDKLGGNRQLRANLKKYNQIAARFPVLVFTDLDERECAPTLIRQWTQGISPSKNLLLRVNVHEVESWLFGDQESFAEFLGIHPSNMPEDPEGLLNPKQTLFNLVRDKSKKREIKAGLLPSNNSGLGPEYNTLLCRFVRNHYSYRRAAPRCNSLERAVRALEALQESD